MRLRTTWLYWEAILFSIHRHNERTPLLHYPSQPSESNPRPGPPALAVLLIYLSYLSALGYCDYRISFQQSKSFQRLGAHFTCVRRDEREPQPKIIP
jgi:hypothetical protein